MISLSLVILEVLQQENSVFIIVIKTKIIFLLKDIQERMGLLD